MRNHVNIDVLFECAVEAARTAGQHALANRHRRGHALSTATHDVKLQLDVECQAKASAVIRRRFPAAAILGEEDARDETAPVTRGAGCETLQWVVDPIDGTVNFSHGFPLWCCSIAVRRGEEALAGAVYAPQLDALYTAAADRPALCNGEPIRVSDVDDPAGAMVFTGTNQRMTGDRSPFLFFEHLTAHVQRPRISGSAALDLCHVACGMGDGYFESGIFTWDVAAAGLIVQRAGGMAEVVSSGEGEALVYLASNGKIQDALRRIVAPALRRVPSKRTPS